MNVIGIDLGTTNSCVAILENKIVTIIKDDDGNTTIPSAIAFDEGEEFVGHAALPYRRNTKNYIYEVKRMIGRSFDNHVVQECVKNYPFNIVNDGNKCKICVTSDSEEKQFYSEEISAKVLKKLKENAENYTQTKINEVVITVPAYFDGNQREYTKVAAKLAGFEIIHLINEPTAAALSFQFDDTRSYKRKVLVYDFGGGTFDVTIASVRGNNCEVLACDGNSFLGGTDVTQNLIRFVVDFIENETKTLVTKEKTLAAISRQCEDAKEQLSFMKEVSFEILNGGDSLNVKITRDDFNRINESIFEKTTEIVNHCLKHAKLTVEDIDEVLLVGGSSRISKIQELLAEKFGDHKISKSVNPDEAVAYGAAIYGASIHGDKKEFNFTDVLSLSFGIGTKGDIMSKIIERNTTLPCENTKIYTTSGHNQTRILIKVYQGESLIASRNNFLQKFSIEGIKPEPRGMASIDVTFRFDKEGLLKITAKDRKSSITEELDIKVESISESEVNTVLEKVGSSEEEEQKYVEFMEDKIDIIQKCEDLIVESGDADKRQFQNLLNEINSLTIGDFDGIRQYRKKLINMTLKHRNY